MSDAEIRAYAWLTTWDFRRTGRMFTGRDEMADALKWSVSKLDGALRALERRGAIKRIRRGLGLCNDIELLAELAPDNDLESHNDASLSGPTVRLPIQERTQERTQDQSAPADPSPRRRTDPRANVVTVAWWNTRNPKPLQPFVNIRGIVDKALKAGHTEEAVLEALRTIGDDPPVIGWKLDQALSKRRPKRRDPRGLNWDRNAG